MGVIIPQVVTSDRASGAQVIDGSVGINSFRNYHLERDPGSAGNRKTFTFSGWVKKHQDTTGEDQAIIEARTSSPSADGDIFGCRFEDDARISVYDYGNFYVRSGVGRMRDTNGWYHIFFSVDTTVASNNVKLYVNNVLVGQGSHAQNTDTRFNSTDTHRIGARDDGSENYWLNAAVTNFYVIDGQALEPTDFGYTDPLTNTWKPKKYTGTFTGTNTFYLPFDGSAPIGQDQSGNGNDWTPVNFGGSVELDSPLVTGARPILNTTQGGTQAGVGVFGSKQNVGYAVTVYDDGGGNKYYIDGVKTASITGLIRGATYTFDTSDSTVSTHPFRLSATSNGSHGGGSEYTNGVAAITGAATTITVPYDAPETLYYYCTSHSGMGNDSSISGITTNEKLADQYASHCVLAIPFTNGDVTDVSPSIACTSTKKTLTKQGDPTSSTSSNFYSSSTDFDGTGDYYTSGSETAFTFGTGDFTVEFWVESDDLGGSNQDGYLQISDTSGGLKTGYANGFAIYEGANAGTVNTAGVSASIPSTGRLIKAGVWNHIALVREGTSVRLYANGFLAGSGTSSKDMTASYLALGGYYGTSYVYNGRMQDFRIYKGVAKYNGSFEVPVTSPAILPDTPSGVAGGSKLTKITDGGVSFNGSDQYLSIADNADFTVGSDPFTIEFYAYKTESGEDFFCGSSNSSGSDSSASYSIQTGGGSPSNSLRAHVGDGSSLTTVNSGVDFPTNRWVHVAFVRDGNTLRLFQDGIQMGTTSFSGTVKDSADPFMIGRGFGANSTKNFPGFISNFRFIKGTALYTSRFTPPTAPLTNVTNTKLLCCQSSTSAIEADVSPSTPTNGGTSLATNFNPFNTDINTVRGQETGYATLSPLWKNSNSSNSGGTFADGNLKHTTDGSNGNTPTCANIYASSGKFYWEVTLTSGSAFGIGVASDIFSSADYPGYGTGATNGQVSWGYNQNGVKIHNATSTSSYGSSYTLGDTIGVAMNLDNGELEYYKNGVSQGVAFTDLEGNLTACHADTGSAAGFSYNFGQKPFKFPPPDGFQPLNAANVRPVNVISRPDQFVGIVTYTGDGNSPRKISGYNFAPDLIWYKQRNSARDHQLYDTVRGSGSNKNLSSNTTYNETANDDELYGYTSAFNDDGFTVTTGSSNFNYANASSSTYVAWAWRAGGNKNTFNVDDVGYVSAAAAGLTGGDITPTGASVGTKQGFSIIKYDGSGTAGDDFPHGLLQTPEFIIVKDTDDTDNWQIYHAGAQTSGAKLLKFTADEATSNTGPWNNTAPTSTLITLGGGGTNDSGNTHICYAWHSVPGLQKFGTYEGIGGTADGSFVELGFRPAIVWVKNIDTASQTNTHWCVFDRLRPGFNKSPAQNRLHLDTSDQEDPDRVDDGQGIDILSNGFRLRSSNWYETNLSGATYIYCAWAEVPSVDLFGGGANAR